MSKVTFKTDSRALKAFNKLATGDGLASKLEDVAAPVMAAARNDPNAYYVSTLRLRRHYSKGRLQRVSIRIGAKQGIGIRVEAKRGTLARALTDAGL